MPAIGPGYIINRSDLNPDRLTDVSGEGVPRNDKGRFSLVVVFHILNLDGAAHSDR